MPVKKKNLNLTSRDRRKIKTRKRLSGTDERPRLSVFKSSKYTYAQIISDVTGKTLASASTMEDDVKKAIAAFENYKAESAKSVNAAKALGTVLARRAKEQQISKVVFDRNGFLYHGRIKAVADGAREGGLDF